MNELQFAKRYINSVSFHCSSCRQMIGGNCKENNKSACVQVTKLLNKLLDEKIEQQSK